MWLMKTLLASQCVNQRGAGQLDIKFVHKLTYSALSFEVNFLCSKVILS